MSPETTRKYFCPSLFRSTGVVVFLAMACAVVIVLGSEVVNAVLPQDWYRSCREYFLSMGMNKVFVGHFVSYALVHTVAWVALFIISFALGGLRFKWGRLFCMVLACSYPLVVVCKYCLVTHLIGLPRIHLQYLISDIFLISALAIPIALIGYVCGRITKAAVFHGNQ